MSHIHSSTGYGLKTRLLFNGDEAEYDLLEVLFLGYMQLKGLKFVITSTAATIDAADKEKAYSELVQLLGEKSLSMITNDATDIKREAYTNTS